MTASIGAFGRLVWRPLSIVGLFPFGLVVGWPFFNQSEALDNGLRVSSRVFLSGALWTESIVFMGLLGAAVSMTGLEAHQPVFAYVVPLLRGKVLRGGLIAGTLVAALLALALVYLGDAGNAVGILTCGMLFFALGSSVPDPITPRSVAFALVLVAIAGGYQSWRVRFVFESAPVVASVGALLFAAVILRRQWATDSARQRAVLATPPVGFVTGGRFRRAYLEGKEVEALPWRGAPSTGGIIDWMQAADYEGFGARRFGWFKLFAGIALYGCGVGYFMLNPGFGALMGVMILSVSGHRLLGNWVYPIGRKARADLHFIWSLVDNAGSFLLAWTVTWALGASGLPRLSRFEDLSVRYTPTILIATAFMWAPLVQWTRTTGPATPRVMKSARWGVQFIFFVLAWLPLTFATQRLAAWLGRTYSVPIVVAAMIGIAIGVQILYWLALRWHFTRRNLV